MSKKCTPKICLPNIVNKNLYGGGKITFYTLVYFIFIRAYILKKQQKITKKQRMKKFKRQKSTKKKSIKATKKTQIKQIKQQKKQNNNKK